MKNFRYLLGREFMMFWSNKVFVFAFSALPLLLALVLGYVYKEGKVKQQPIIVVDKDDSPSSAKFRDMLADNEVLDIIQTNYESVELQQALLDKRAVALVEIPYLFEANLLSGKKPEINCYLNLSNTLTSNAAGRAVNSCAATLNAGIAVSMLQGKGIAASHALEQYQSFNTITIFKYNPAGNYLYFLWPALIFSTLHQLILLALAVSFSGEYARNDFHSHSLLGYSRSAILLVLVKVLPYCLLSMVTAVMYFFLSQFFRIPIAANPLLLFFSQFLFISGACFLGTLFSIINPFPIKATQVLMSVASPAFSLSGFTWPSDQAPALLRDIGQAIPLTPYLRSLRLLLFQNGQWPAVWPQLQQQLIIAAVFFLLSVLVLHYKIKRTVRKDYLPDNPVGIP